MDNKSDQNDHKIAELGLTRILQDTGGKANLVHIWVPGYAPMEKRMETYTRFMASHPGLHEIDVVWATWDEFAKGAANAIRRAEGKKPEEMTACPQRNCPSNGSSTRCCSPS